MAMQILIKRSQSMPSKIKITRGKKGTLSSYKKVNRLKNIQNQIAILNVYAPNNKPRKYVKKKLIGQKKENLQQNWRLQYIFSKICRTFSENVNEDIE